MPDRPTARPPAPPGWYQALIRAWRAGALSFAELCWLIKTRGSGYQERMMKAGDTVLILTDDAPPNTTGTLRKQAEIAIGRRVRVFWIVVFDDGHEGAYEEFELQVVEKGGDAGIKW